MSNKNVVVAQWVVDHMKDLLKWAIYKTSSRDLAEDLVQDTFLTAIQSFENFRGDSHVKTWLFSILKNKIADHYRKNNRPNPLTEKLNEDSALQITDSMFLNNESWSKMENVSDWTDETNLLDDEDFNSILNNCLDDLPGNWRHIIEAKFIYERNSDLICQDFDISSSNYWQIIHRSKLLLKKCIEKSWLS